MILLSGVTHEVRTGPITERIVTNVTARIPSDRRVALLGNKPAINAALFDLLAGIVPPTAGAIRRYGRISFPVGFAGGFSMELTVRQNVEYVAKIYDQPLNETVDFVKKWSGIGPAFDQPFIKLPRSMLREIISIVAFSIPFDMYLLTANRKVTVSPLWSKFYELFKLRSATSGFIASADPHFARLHCDMGMLVRNRRIELFEDIEEAIRMADETAADTESNRRDVDEPHPSKLAED